MPHSLGIVHRCIGFVKKQQGLADDSFNAYLEAMRHFKDTVGEKSHYVAQMCSNLGASHMAKGEYETARYIGALRPTHCPPYDKTSC